MNWSPADPTSIIAPTAMRAHYVSLTDRLIHRLEEVAAPERLHLLFLDKSGRPVAWLVRALWSTLARVPGTACSDRRIPPMPTMSFANIDREQWWDVTGGSETGWIDVSRVPVEQVMQLRLAYLRSEPAPMLNPQDALEQPTWLDGKHIVVIDEVRASGDTLTIAGGLVQRAFPTNLVETAHWMAPEVRRGRESGVAQQIHNPVWYRSDTPAGRLVGDRQAPDHRGRHWRGRSAPLFLSTVPRERDRMGLRLRSEISAIGRAVAAGQLLSAPAATRDVDDAAERIETLYGYTDLRLFTQHRIEQGATP